MFSSKVLAKGAVKVQFRDSVSNLLTDDIVQSSLSAVKFNLMRRDVVDNAFANDIELVYVSAQSAFVGEYISTVAGTLDMQVSACDSSDPPVCEEVPISGYTGTVISLVVSSLLWLRSSALIVPQNSKSLKTRSCMSSGATLKETL